MLQLKRKCNEGKRSGTKIYPVTPLPPSRITVLFNFYDIITAAAPAKRRRFQISCWRQNPRPRSALAFPRTRSPWVGPGPSWCLPAGPRCPATDYPTRIEVASCSEFSFCCGTLAVSAIWPGRCGLWFCREILPCTALQFQNRRQ